MLAPLFGLLLSGTLNRTVARTKRNGIFVGIAAILILTAYAFDCWPLPFGWQPSTAQPFRRC